MNVTLKAQQVSEAEVRANVHSVIAQPLDATGNRRLIEANTVRTIAAWWQSASPTGRHLASLQSGAQVNLDDLLDNVNFARNCADADNFDVLALDRLADWALENAR